MGINSGKSGTVEETGLFIQGELTVAIIGILDKGMELDQSLQMVCDAIFDASSQGNKVSARISFDNREFRNKKFKEADSALMRYFHSPDNKKGSVELFLSSRKSKPELGVVITEAELALNSIVPLLVGIISKFQLKKLAIDIGERQKELKSINRTTEILKKSTSLYELLLEICSCLPEAMQYPGHTVARIKYGDRNFISPNFRETPWMLQQTFDTPDSTKGAIEIYYLKKFPNCGEGPFLIEERSLIDNLSALISGTASKKALEDLLIRNTERLKELKGINQTSEILQNSKSLEESLPVICSILPESWQYPEHTVARIS